MHLNNIIMFAPWSIGILKTLFCGKFIEIVQLFAKKKTISVFTGVTEVHPASLQLWCYCHPVVSVKPYMQNYILMSWFEELQKILTRITLPKCHQWNWMSGGFISIVAYWLSSGNKLSFISLFVHLFLWHVKLFWMILMKDSSVFLYLTVAGALTS